MNQTNLEIILTNVICCIAKKSIQFSKLLSIGSKCYKKELRDLKILNDTLKVLSEEGFTQNSIFQQYLNIEFTQNILSPSEYITFYINNIPVIIYGNDQDTLLDQITNYVESINGSITVTPIIGNNFYLINITLSCNVVSFRFSVPSIPVSEVVSDPTIFNNVQSGICTGCLTEEQINKLSHLLMKHCNICDCQLT